MELGRHLMSDDEAESKPFSMLIVDDEEIARLMLKVILSENYPEARLYFAENGAIGLELFKEHQPDMVITDNNMPIMTGVEMASEIQSLNPETIILFMTADSGAEFLLRLKETGIEHCMHKPFKAEELLHVIGGCINT